MRNIYEPNELKQLGFNYYSLEEILIKKKSHNFHQSIIREYDIRGIYGETLFDIDAEILGNLFGKIIENTINIACFEDYHRLV